MLALLCTIDPSLGPVCSCSQSIAADNYLLDINVEFLSIGPLYHIMTYVCTATILVYSWCTKEHVEKYMQFSLSVYTNILYKGKQIAIINGLDASGGCLVKQSRPYHLWRA